MDNAELHQMILSALVCTVLSHAAEETPQNTNMKGFVLFTCCRLYRYSVDNQ